MACMRRAVPIVLDLVCVLIFAIIGRASHSESPIVGALGTAWPFLVACLVGWVILTVLSDDGMGVRGTVIVWLVTLAGGMTLRVAAGGTTHWSFILVAAIFLGIVFSGWRLIGSVLRRRRA